MAILLRATMFVVAVATSATLVPAIHALPQAQDTTARRTQRTLDSLTTALRELRLRLDSVSGASGTPVVPVPSVAPQSRPGAYMNISFDGITNAGWSTERNVQALNRGDHDPRVRGFGIPNGEIVFDGAVDPYFKGFTSVVLKLDENGETGIELEEMYFLTTSLPRNLQLKGGQFFTEFGRQNSQHPHAWAFVDQPLVLNRMLGGEGLRSQGARLSWLLPTSFYSEALLTVANSAGGTAYSFRSDESSEIHGGVAAETGVNGVGDLLIAPRLTTSFDPTANQTVLLGASMALGPNNSGPKANTKIYGADVYWKWKSPTARQGFPFVSLQTEVLYRHYDALERPSAGDESTLLVGETLKDKGAYSQVLWGIRPMLVAGLRGEFVSGNAGAFTNELRDRRYRVSPNVTWYPTEYSKLRLQYNHDNRKGIGTDHSLWLQFEFLLGAHAAHKF